MVKTALGQRRMVMEVTGKDYWPLVSVIILNHNGYGFLEACLGSVFESDYPNFEVILVDNASTDGSAKFAEQLYAEDKRFKIIYNLENLFYAGGNNVGIAHSRGDYVVFLNNDTVVESDWIKELVRAFLRREEIGAAQPKILAYDDDCKIDNVGGAVDVYGFSRGIGRFEMDEGQYDSEAEIFYGGGTALIVRRSVLDEVGGFDPKFYAYSEDLDLSWRIRLRGYEIVMVPNARVYHRISQTVSQKCSNLTFRYDLLWHIRKNRLAALIKNYGYSNLFRVLPGIIIIYFLMFIKEMMVDNDWRLARTSLRALFWNLKELRYLIRCRLAVQHLVRKVPDSAIIRMMQKELMFIQACRLCKVSKT